MQNIGVRMEKREGSITRPDEEDAAVTGANSKTKTRPRHSTAPTLLQHEKQNIDYPRVQQQQRNQSIKPTDPLNTAGRHAIISSSTTLPVLRGIGKNRHSSSTSCGEAMNIPIPQLSRCGLRRNKERITSPSSQGTPIPEEQEYVVQDIDSPTTSIEELTRGRGEDVEPPPAAIAVPTRTEEEVSVSANNEEDSSSSSNRLVEALPVESEQFSSSIMEAQPVANQMSSVHGSRGAKDKFHLKLASGIVVSCFVLSLSLALGLQYRKRNKNVTPIIPGTTGSSSTDSSTATEPLLPPMEQLELLFGELPANTRERLYNDRESPQYMAWEWLLNHPNLSSLEEWRKKQMFAMATFFYSFDGPNWPKEAAIGHKRWMNYTTDECSWVLSDTEVIHFTIGLAAVFGPDVFAEEDVWPCNADGQLKNLALHNLYLPPMTTKTISIPPEIGLLTSLRILAIGYSEINAKLSDMLVPELVELPSFESLLLHDIGLRGTLPNVLGEMTKLKHLLIGSNHFTGSVPSQIGRMTSLEAIILSDMEGGSNGKIPSEMGLLTSLTSLVMFGCTFTGHIPSELGQMTNAAWLDLYQNNLAGSLPSQLGLITAATQLDLWNNALTGSIPSEVGLMTNALRLRLGNDLDLPGSQNNFMGSLPRELWKLSNLKGLFLPNLPNLSGSIPEEKMIMPNLTVLSLSGSPQLAGTIPEHICFIKELDFDCSDLLCGCECQCNK